MKQNLVSYLGQNSYPGRGIILGKSEDGACAVIAYFIMGRSTNSRNRIFRRMDGGIRTEANDPSQMQDPSLIIYAPVRTLEQKTIVTNGDQTDTIYEGLKAGKSFQEALRTRKFEPDAPNFTPRISGLLTLRDGNFDYTLSILKSNAGDASECLRFFYEYDAPQPGEGHLIHTYERDASPLPSFCGEPVSVALTGEIHQFSGDLWKALDEQNRISLFVRYLNLKSGAHETVIINKNRGDEQLHYSSALTSGEENRS